MVAFSIHGHHRWQCASVGYSVHIINTAGSLWMPSLSPSLLMGLCGCMSSTQGAGWSMCEFFTHWPAWMLCCHHYLLSSVIASELFAMLAWSHHHHHHLCHAGVETLSSSVDAGLWWWCCHCHCHLCHPCPCPCPPFLLTLTLIAAVPLLLLTIITTIALALSIFILVMLSFPSLSIRKNWQCHLSL